jgi:hypothetical protein
MREDGRVSCLRHPRNVGLPAISEFEAYCKARADYMAFAFDDDFFYPNALEELLKHSVENPGRVCFGTAVWRLNHPDKERAVVRLGEPLDRFNLKSTNAIANMSVMLSRKIIERVGFYDPHVLIARLCDWDLWRRISDAGILLQHVNVEVGEVTEQGDSLGHNYLLVAGDCDEWMRGTRRCLLPSKIPEIDIFDRKRGISKHAEGTILHLMEHYTSTRPWMATGGRASDRNKVDDKNIFVLTDGYSASTSLCFDNLPSSLPGRIRIISTDVGPSTSELATASCVIIVRLIDRYRIWLDTASSLGIPIYYFLDDNLPELAAQENLSISEDLSTNRLRIDLRKFSGVLLSSETLLSYFQEKLIHPNLYYFPVSFYRRPPQYSGITPKAQTDLSRKSVLTIGSIAGVHRQTGLRETVLPALRRLADEGHRIHAVIGGASAEDIERVAEFEDKNLAFILLPRQMDWNRAVAQLAEHCPDILVHAPSKTINNKYKTLNVALCAHILDAVLVVPNEAPYTITAFDGASVRVESPHEPRAWLQALSGLLAAPDKWTQLKQANEDYCRTNFSGEQNIVVLNQILQDAPAVSSTLVESRLKQLYYSISEGGPAKTSYAEPIRTSLLELSALRTTLRGRRLRRPSKEDLWPLVSPAFDDIRRYALDRQIRKPNTYLELSDSIHDKNFVEYSMLLEEGALDALRCAISSEGIHEGQVGVELVSAAGEIVFQTTRDLASLTLQQPVSFNLNGTIVPKMEVWRVRLFARTRWPVYVLEFATYSPVRRTRRAVAPFAMIRYSPVRLSPDNSSRN